MGLKKTVSFLLATCMVFLLFGCGSNTEKNEPVKDTSTDSVSTLNPQENIGEKDVAQKETDEPEEEPRVVYLLSKYMNDIAYTYWKIYNFDEGNHLISTKIEDNDSDVEVETRYTYENGRIVTSMINETCRGEYIYDDNGSLTEIHYVHRTGESDFGYKFIYNDHGNISEVNFYGELPESNVAGDYPLYAAETYMPGVLYMGYFPMITLNQLYSFGMGVSCRFEYQYDNDGNIISCVRQAKDDESEGFEHFELDSEGRVTQYWVTSYRQGVVKGAYNYWVNIPRFDFEKWSFEYHDNGDISAIMIRRAPIRLDGYEYERTEYTLNQGLLTSRHVKMDSHNTIPVDTLEEVSYEQWKDKDFLLQYAYNSDFTCKRYNIENYGDSVHISIDRIDEKGFLSREDIESYEYLAVPIQGNTLPDFPFVIVP